MMKLRSLKKVRSMVFTLCITSMVAQPTFSIRADETVYENPVSVGSVKELEEEVVEVEGIQISDSDFEWLIRVVAAESLSEGYEGQRMVAGVIIGRMLEDKGDFRQQDTIEKVVKAKGQFSSVWDGGIERHKPTEETIQACKDELLNPQYTYLRFFRTGHYGYGTPAFKYKNHYFSK